jgi:rhomboid family protein
MFPISDDDSQRRTLPVVTYALVGLNGLVFLLELSAGDRFVENWAFIPANFAADPAANVVTIFTAMFMHGGWLHLLGNMLFLWIFGDNVEDRLDVGASGAIAGVLGAYILMFPQSRVNVLLGNQIVAMPAVIVLTPAYQWHQHDCLYRRERECRRRRLHGPYRRLRRRVPDGISPAWHAPTHHGLIGWGRFRCHIIGKAAYWPKGSILSLMSTCGLTSVSSLALGFSPAFFAGVVGFAA